MTPLNRFNWSIAKRLETGLEPLKYVYLIVFQVDAVDIDELRRTTRWIGCKRVSREGDGSQLAERRQESIGKVRDGVAFDVKLVHENTVAQRLGYAAQPVVAQTQPVQIAQLADTFGNIQQFIVLQIQRW